MKAIPRDPRLEATFALLRDPYRYISRRAENLGTNLFLTRLMFRPTICMTGRDAAELFYDRERFVRADGPPALMEKTLLGQGGVQTLDEEPHLHRKRMLMQIATGGGERSLAELFEEWLRRYAAEWEKLRYVELYPEIREILCRAVCAWTEVPLDESEVAKRTAEITALFDHGRFALRYLSSFGARRRGEAWIGGIISSVRSGALNADPESALSIVALHRDHQGHILDLHTAAVELLNVLRPTVALSVSIVQLAHALYRYSARAENIKRGSEEYAELFVQEVRRFYPVFPFITARAAKDFEWSGFHFPKGKRAVLDIYGTNHDPKIWEDPEHFRPERFANWNQDPFSFIPQGGGDAFEGHRGAGEAVTLEIMKRAALFLTNEISYQLAAQDPRIDFRRLPALPRSEFIIRNIQRRKGRAAAAANY